MIYAYIIIYIVCMVVNSYIYKKKINFCNLIITLWTVASILSMFGFYGMLVPNIKTYVYILCFIVSFEVFSVLFYKSKIFKGKEEKHGIQKNDLEHRKINIILIILIGIMLIFAAEGLKIIIQGGSFSEIRDAYLNSENFSNKLQMFISIAIIPIAHAIGVYSIIEFVDKKKITLTLGLYLLLLCELIIFTGGRGAIVDFAIIIGIALMDKYNNNIIKIVKENKKIILILMVVAIIVCAITLQRNLAGKGIIYNIYCYVVGNIHLLGVYVKNPERFLLTNDNLLYGQILISGFSYPITFILRLLGADIKAGLYILYETTQKFVAIAPNTMINNSVTMLVFALRDFGITGIFIYSCVLSLFFSLLLKRKEKNNSLLNKALYYYFIKCSIFLLWDFQFSKTSIIFTFVYLILLSKFCTNANSKNIMLREDKNDK